MYPQTRIREAGVFRSRLYSLAISLAAFAAACGPATGAALPQGFTETKLLSGINPSAMELAPDGRLFFCDKSGKVRVVKDGTLQDTPFLSLDVDFTEERGLLGLAFDPAYSTGSAFIYVYYTAKNPSHNRISRFPAGANAVSGAEQILLDLDNLTNVGWHNGGAIHFGKDGKLYIAAGNNTNNGYSQSLTSLLGKILRINPDGSIPADNPFEAATGKYHAIWALGLRNPFTAAVHPTTGAYFVNDVGEGTNEEINDATAGSNFGWPKSEGHAATAPTGLTGTYNDPVSWYQHNGTCALTGGTFYHPPVNPFGAAYQDLYFFSDYCGGWIKTFNPKDKAVKEFATGINRPIDLKVGPDGVMYYLSRGNRAAGVGSGSAADNSSTADGGLFRVKGSAPVGVSPMSRRAPHVSLDGRIPVPAGARSLRLAAVDGSQVAEYHFIEGARPEWIAVPAGLSKRMLLLEVR